MLISLMDGSLVWSNQHHQSGTLMPSGPSTPSLRGALATKQSIPRHTKAGLLRGACHRARIRATRRLAMTAHLIFPEHDRRHPPRHQRHKRGDKAIAKTVL